MVNTDRLCMGCMNDNGGEKICSICGYDSSEDNAPEFLAVGTWLNANRYLLGRVIEENGDGVTYIGWDNETNAVVNIKEYFPHGIAERRPDRLTVTPREDKALSFTRGMDSFTDLFFRLRNQPESTAILRVVDIFEANGTMYAVQSTISGTTLKSFLIRNGGTLKWEQVKPLFMPLLATISDLNNAGIVHRGISPDNIIVGRDGKLRLTGFCIKEVRVEHTEFLSYLSSGYAAPEQHLENDTYSASCDVYAIGAVMFRTLIGVTPPDAKDRLANDKLSVPAKVTEVVPKGALVSIANALKVDKTERVSSAERLYKMLETVSIGTAVMPNVDANGSKPQKKKISGKSAAIIASAITAVIFIILFIIFWLLFGGLLTKAPDDNSSSSTPAPIITDNSSVNSGYAPEGGTYPIPELIGSVYTDVYGDMQTEYSQFKFEVGGRIPSDKYQRGFICDVKVNGVSVKAGDKAPRDTVIEVYISQGPDKVTMPNIIGKTVDQAKSMLFDAGFYSDTIILRKAYEEFVLPGQVFKVTYGEDDASIVAGTKVSLNELIIVYYREEEETSTESETVTE